MLAISTESCTWLQALAVASALGINTPELCMHVQGAAAVYGTSRKGPLGPQPPMVSLEGAKPGTLPPIAAAVQLTASVSDISVHIRPQAKAILPHHVSCACLPCPSLWSPTSHNCILCSLLSSASWRSSHSRTHTCHICHIKASKPAAAPVCTPHHFQCVAHVL